jgi:hypothetical protein
LGDGLVPLAAAIAAGFGFVVTDLLSTWWSDAAGRQVRSLVVSSSLFMPSPLQFDSESRCEGCADHHRTYNISQVPTWKTAL